jgi:hypothetical protein
MSEDVHAYAQQLVAQERAERLSTADCEWLDQHLEACAKCAGHAASTDRALRSLRSISVRLDPSLVGRTRLRVRLHAQEMHEQQPRRRALWVSCGISWALGAASGPYVWQGFEWIGHHSGVPNLIWQMGFVLWWAAPALVAAGILLVANPSRAAHERP